MTTPNNPNNSDGQYGEYAEGKIPASNLAMKDMDPEVMIFL